MSQRETNTEHTKNSVKLVGAARRLPESKRPYWQSRVARYPTHPPKMFWGGGWIALQVSGGTWRPPRSVSLEHEVEDGKQLAHHGDPRHLGLFAGRAQAQIERPEQGI